MMLQHNEDKQQSEVKDGYYKEISRDDLRGMIFQEGPPGLRGWLAMPGHIFGDGSFRNRNPQLQQLALTSIPSLDEVQRIPAKIPDSFSKDAETERRDRICMARYFFDTSALAKLYQRESGSGKVAQILAEPDRTIVISRLTVIEVTSMLARRVSMHQLSEADAVALRNHFLNDVATGQITVVAITDAHFRKMREPGSDLVAGLSLLQHPDDLLLRVSTLPHLLVLLLGLYPGRAPIYAGTVFGKVGQLGPLPAGCATAGLPMDIIFFGRLFSAAMGTQPLDEIQDEN